jgi:peptidoglycan hydrolase CwlO-like protein
MRKRSIVLVVILAILVLMFAFTRTLRGEDVSRELRQKNAEISNHNTEKRQYENRPSNTKIDPSYEKYLNSKSDRLDRERNQIIERGFREQNRRGK